MDIIYVMLEIWNKIQQFGIVLMIVMLLKDKFRKFLISILDSLKHHIYCFIVHPRKENHYKIHLVQVSLKILNK